MVESHDFLVPGAKHRTWMTFNLVTALILATVLALVTLVLTKTGDPVVPGADPRLDVQHRPLSRHHR